ncbi:MAG TPA: HTTM domain-containing protein [Myxococcota bacterium]|nr:HTTM domain-containing protein [Myxococcota bacterium]
MGTRRAWPWIAAIVLAWIAIGEGLAPQLIAWLYRAEPSSFAEPLARALARAQTRHSLTYYVDSWREDGRWAVLALLGYQALALATRARGFAARFVPPATPGALGATRALVAGVLLASTLWEHLPSSALLPRELIHGEGPLLALLYALPIGFERFVASPFALGAFQAATALLLGCAALGFRTRWSVPLAAFAYLVLGGILRQYAWFYHTGLIPLYLLAVLAFTPCGDGFSLDRWLRARRGEPVPDARAASLAYGWPRYLSWTVLALTYVFAGLSKLRRGGLDWAHADNLKSILLVDTLNPMQFDWGMTLRLLHEPDALFWAIGLATLAGEIGYGLVLFSRRARIVLPLTTLGVHLGIWLLQNVLFFDLIILQALVFDWDTARSWVARRAPGLSGVRRETRARERGSPSTDGSGNGRARWPRRLRVLAAALIACWAIRIEEFPFTAMQMYSKPNLSGVVEWYAVVATFESGEPRRAPIEAALPAFRDARYRRVIRQGFEAQAEKQALARAFLASFLRTHNASAAAGGRIRCVEAQRWRWDYAREPDDPQHGEIVGRIRVEGAS